MIVINGCRVISQVSNAELANGKDLYPVVNIVSEAEQAERDQRTVVRNLRKVHSSALANTQ